MAFETAITSHRLVLLTFIIVSVCVVILYRGLDALNPSPYYTREAAVRNDRSSHDEEPLGSSGAGPPFPNDANEHIDWFIQISDLHISKFHWPTIPTDLTHFIEENINVIKPKAVLVTGDLTDSKHRNMQGSEQYEEEWRTYHRVLTETKVQEMTVWLDTRGNHDDFDVSSLESKENYFRQYSAQKRSPSSYRYEHRSASGDSYSFISVDACPDPGPKRPFNFIGLLTEERMAVLRQYAADSKSSNLTLWFGHYPTSTIGSPQPELRRLIGQGAVYMCGHFHSLGGTVPAMYAPQKEGYLELELADWKENRMYRVFAVDHGLFSFTDQVFSASSAQWPVVLITNPKHAQFTIPSHEPLDRMLKSTHIRILVWSVGDIESVEVSVDHTELGRAVRAGEGPLYTVPWQPQLYSTGVHTITVTVKDSLGNTRVEEQPFSLDGTVMTFNFLRRFILMSDVSFVLKFCFWCAFTGAVLPLILVKFFIFKVQVLARGSCTGRVLRYCQVWLRRYYLLASTPAIFYPLLLSTLYLPCGPMFMGYILDKHFGVCFVWGIYVKGVFIPGTLTYCYAFFHVLLFTLPLTLHLGRCLDLAVTASHNPPAPIPTPVRWLWQQSTYILLMALLAYQAVGGFYLSYGGVAFLLGPMRTWSFFLGVYLKWVAVHQKHAPYMNNDLSTGDKISNDKNYLYQQNSSRHIHSRK